MCKVIDKNTITLLTDNLGNDVNVQQKIRVPESNLLSKRKFKKFHYEIYHNNVGNSYVIKRNVDNNISMTDFFCLGSGLLGGQYPTDANTFRTRLVKPFFIQDNEHESSVLYASQQTNEVIDKMIASAIQFFEEKDVHRLTNLWNIALARVEDKIEEIDVHRILVRYIDEYNEESIIIDSRFNYPLQELPINYILKHLGYDGVINPLNAWKRESVAFKLTDTTLGRSLNPTLEPV